MNNSKPLISVIMSAYNSEKSIGNIFEFLVLDDYLIIMKLSKNSKRR